MIYGPVCLEQFQSELLEKLLNINRFIVDVSKLQRSQKPQVPINHLAYPKKVVDLAKLTDVDICILVLYYFNLDKPLQILPRVYRLVLKIVWPRGSFYKYLITT